MIFYLEMYLKMKRYDIKIKSAHAFYSQISDIKNKIVVLIVE